MAPSMVFRTPTLRKSIDRQWGQRVEKSAASLASISFKRRLSPRYGRPDWPDCESRLRCNETGFRRCGCRGRDRLPWPQ